MKIAEKILSDLKKQYPNKISRKELTFYQYGYRAGQQNIIDTLTFLIKKMKENR